MYAPKIINPKIMAIGFANAINNIIDRTNIPVLIFLSLLRNSLILLINSSTSEFSSKLVLLTFSSIIPTEFGVSL